VQLLVLEEEGDLGKSDGSLAICGVPLSAEGNRLLFRKKGPQ